MVERAELRRLAEAIKEQGPAWYRPGLLFDLLGAAVLDTEQCEMDAAYIAAVSPDVVLGLLDENAQLRAVAVMLKGALQELESRVFEDGAPDDVLEETQGILADPEVEKL